MTGLTGFPFDDRDEILRLADAYWANITGNERVEERASERELPAARAAGYLTKPLFVRLARWKSVRNTSRCEANSDGGKEAATRRAFGATVDAEAIAALTSLHGVALRTATALLHWMRPEDFPILDVRLLAALNEPQPWPFENPTFFSRVADRIRTLGQQHGLDFRTVDRALWNGEKLNAKK
jgi:hypothetical protein